MCASLRRASRALTQQYDAALRPLGLTITQFTILQALTLVREVSQGQLGNILAMDSTTLTRTLMIMRKRRWIEARLGSDRRQRLLGLSPAGEAHFHRALPHWQRAQQRLRMQLGNKRWNNLTSLINDVTSVVAE